MRPCLQRLNFINMDNKCATQDHTPVFDVSHSPPSYERNISPSAVGDSECGNLPLACPRLDSSTVLTYLLYILNIKFLTSLIQETVT